MILVREFSQRISHEKKTHPTVGYGIVRRKAIPGSSMISSTPSQSTSPSPTDARAAKRARSSSLMPPPCSQSKPEALIHSREGHHCARLSRLSPVRVGPPIPAAPHIQK